MIWIIGSKGMLGSELANYLTENNISFIGTDIEVSILDKTALQNHIDKHNPEWIVNCSAYTAVDLAEDEPDKAFLINRDGVRNIAETARDNNIPLIHVSTDYVFPGNNPSALKESDPTGPIGVYGKSKLEGELVLQQTWEKHFIIRTAWLYGKYGKNFVYTMLKFMNTKPELKIINDQYGSPSNTYELSRLIKQIIADNSSAYGIYHYSGEGETTWFGFAAKIQEQALKFGLITNKSKLNPCATAEYPTKATRPSYSLLDKSKIRAIFNFHPEKWEKSLEIFLKGLNINDIK